MVILDRWGNLLFLTVLPFFVLIVVLIVVNAVLMRAAYQSVGSGFDRLDRASPGLSVPCGEHWIGYVTTYRRKGERGDFNGNICFDFSARTWVFVKHREDR